MAKVQKGWRIEESLIDQIKGTKPENKTESEWVADLITIGLENVTNPVTESTTGVDAAVTALTDQLSVKDKQISDLSSALLVAQEANKALSANAALHTAADKREDLAIESAEQKEERKSRWQRLKEAWRG